MLVHACRKRKKELYHKTKIGLIPSQRSPAGGTTMNCDKNVNDDLITSHARCPSTHCTATHKQALLHFIIEQSLLFKATYVGEETRNLDYQRIRVQ